MGRLTGLFLGLCLTCGGTELSLGCAGERQVVTYLRFLPFSLSQDRGAELPLLPATNFPSPAQGPHSPLT